MVGHLISYIDNKMPGTQYRSDNEGNQKCLMAIGKLLKVLHSGETLVMMHNDSKFEMYMYSTLCNMYMYTVILCTCTLSLSLLQKISFDDIECATKLFPNLVNLCKELLGGTNPLKVLCYILYMYVRLCLLSVAMVTVRCSNQSDWPIACDD